MHHIETLRAEFTKRKSKNPFYSLRAFARDLHISPASLSLILLGKRTLTVSMARRVLARLPMPTSDQEKFLLSVVMGTAPKIN